MHDRRQTDAMASTQPASGALGLKQYTKDVPPRWKPHSYTIREYMELLSVWSKLTKLDPEQVGPAIVSRLDGAALRVALNLAIVRYEPDPTLTAAIAISYRGAEAVSCVATADVINATDGTVLIPAQDGGAKILLERLQSIYNLDSQDMAWTTAVSTLAAT